MRVFVVGTAFPSFKALAKRTRKSAQVNASFRLPFRLAIHLRWLALTSVGFGRVQIRTQVDARISPLGHPTQVDTSWSQVNCVCVKFTTFCDLRELASRLANPFGHPSQVRTQVLVLQTCVDLRVRLASGIKVRMREYQKAKERTSGSQCFVENKKIKKYFKRVTCTNLLYSVVDKELLLTLYLLSTSANLFSSSANLLLMTDSAKTLLRYNH